MAALRTMLMLVVLVATGTVSLPAAAVQTAQGPADEPAEEPTGDPARQPSGAEITGELQCPGNTFLVTVTNYDDQTYTVEASLYGAPPVTATVGAYETVEIPVPLSQGTSFPFDVYVTGDNGFEGRAFQTLLGCPTENDLRVTTQQDTPVESDVCGSSFSLTPPHAQHGTAVTRDDGWGFVYTPDPGFVGDDSFGYECVGAANVLGTVYVTVTAAPPASPAAAPAPVAAPAAPVPARPSYTG